MKSSKIIEKFRTVCNRFKVMLRLPFPRFLKHQSEVPREKSGFRLGKPHSIAYQLIGEKTEHILPLFEDLDQNLQKSGLKINFKAYVSLTVFTSLLISFITFAIIPFPLTFALGISLFPAFLFGIGGGLFAFAFSIFGFYFYPIYRADKLKRELEDELPFTTGYMAILTSAGVSPEKIFYSLSNLNVPLTVSYEAKNIVRDVNLFGLDIISSLEETAKWTPSERFREMLEGFISTVHSGSNLATYLREKSKQYMKLKRINLKKYSDTLSMLSEFYVTLLLTGPLLLVIMLAVMVMLGGSGLGMLSPDLILNLLTYLGIPIGAIIFLIILDAVSPKW
jgi:flagellar protein FlaJ